MKTAPYKRIATSCLSVAALALAVSAPAAWGVTLDSSGTGPNKIEIECIKNGLTVKSKTFDENMSIYKLSGLCMTKLYFKDLAPVPVPGPTFDVDATWNPKSMVASESITVHKHLAADGTQILKDAYIGTTTTCTSDPWANASPGCQQGKATEGAGSPPGTLKLFMGKYGSNYPVSRLLMSAADKKKHHDELAKKAPRILVPLPNTKFTKGKVLVQAFFPFLPFLADDLGTWTVDFEYLATGGPGAKVLDHAPISGGQYGLKGTPLAVSGWQVRARSRSPKHTGLWSDPVKFEVSGQP